MDFEEARRRAAHALADIHSPGAKENVKFERHSLSAEELPVPELILFALTQLRDFKPFGPGEKLRWGICAKFRTTPFYVSLEKFGLRLHVPKDTLSETLSSLIQCLHTASKLAETYLRDVAQYQIDSARVTIENRHHHFRGAYSFFRDKARETYDSSPPEPIVIQRDEDGTPTGWSESPWQPQIEGGYLAGAMLEAYFSWLEHILVLVLPFIDFNPAEGQLLRFVGATWDEKWRSIFDLSTDPIAKQNYDLLKRLKESVRNPISHGGFGKKGTSFFFHVEGVGALPALLTKHGRSFEFMVSQVPGRTYQEICDQLDLCDAFLQASKVWAGLRCAEAGLDVAFSEDARRQYRQASASDELLEEFIERQSYFADMHRNMDY